MTDEELNIIKLYVSKKSRVPDKEMEVGDVRLYGYVTNLSKTF